MKLFQKPDKRTISDETLDRLLAEAYDARLTQAFPLGGRRQPEGLTEEAAPDSATAAAEEPRPIRAIPAGTARWRTVAAAAIFLIFLGGGAWLLSRSLHGDSGTPTAPVQPVGTDSASDPSAVLRRAAPENCHSAELGGETIYIFDGEYEGEYDILDASALIYSDGASRDELRDQMFQIYKNGRRIDLSSALPDGLKKRQILSYDKYRSFCDHWDLNVKYDDPNQNYLVYTFAYMSTNREVQPILSDVTWTDGAARLYLWVNDPSPYSQYRALFPAIRVLVVPTTNRAETVELRTVLKREDYAQRLEGYRSEQAGLAKLFAPVLQNCHPAELGGETVYVLNDPEGEYDGEYDVQKVNTEKDFFPAVLDGSFENQAPEDFSQKTVMSYDDYAAYCEAWGLTQKYNDPDQSYLVCTRLLFAWEDTRPCLADVLYRGQTIAVFLWKTADPVKDKGSSLRAMARTAWVLTMPTDQSCETVEIYEVMDEAEYLLKQKELERQAKNTMETLPDGTVRITGYANTTIYKMTGHYGGVPAEFEVCVGDETVCIWVEDTELENPDGTPFTNYERWNYLEPGGGEISQYLCIRAEGCERINDRGLLGNTDNYPDYRAAKLIVCCDPNPEKALEAVRPAFIPLSLDEIQARAKDPDQYKDELRFKDWVGCVHECAVFNYGDGYCCSIRNSMDGQLLGAWLFDRDLNLRETLAGWATEMPEGEALTEALKGGTVEDLEAGYGRCLFDGGSGLWLPTWFTTDGRIVVVTEVGGLKASERRVLTERSIPVKTERFTDEELDALYAKASAGVDYADFVERYQGVEIWQREEYNADAARTALFYGETKLLFLVLPKEGEPEAAPVPYLLPMAASAAAFDGLCLGDRDETVERLDPNGIYSIHSYLLENTKDPLAANAVRASYYTEDGWCVRVNYLSDPEDPGLALQSVERFKLAHVYTDYSMTP